MTTAGISVGEHDYLRAVLDELGAEQRFWKLRMRPGAPVGFGLLEDVPVDRPARESGEHDGDVRALRPAGHPEDGRPPLPFRRTVPVRLAEPVRLKPKLQHFLRAVVTDGAGGPEARLTGPQGSGILTSMVMANALLIIPEGQLETPAGATARALLLDDPVHAAEPAF